MKPVLIVEGKAIEVETLFYRGGKVHSASVADGNGVTKMYVDIDENTQYYTEKPLQIDFSKSLVWPGQHDETIKTLNAHLEESELFLQELKNRISDEVICNSDLPFYGHTIEIKKLIEEHFEHKAYVDGIAASIELVKGLDCGGHSESGENK